MELKKVQWLLILMKDELVTVCSQQTKTQAQLSRFCVQVVNKTAETTEPKSVLTKSELPAKQKKVVRESESGLGVPPTAACSALPAKCIEFKNHCKALVLWNHFIPGLAKKKTEQPRAKVANTGKSHAFAKVTISKERSKKPPIAAKKRVETLETLLKKVQDARKQGIESSIESRTQATSSAAQLAASFRRITEGVEDAKMAVDRLTNSQS